MKSHPLSPLGAHLNHIFPTEYTLISTQEGHTGHWTCWTGLRERLGAEKGGPPSEEQAPAFGIF